MPGVSKVTKPAEKTKAKFMSTFEVESDKSYLETDIDKLYNIIKEEKTARMSKVSKRLGVPEEKIQDWVDILEEHKLIDIDYPVMGDPVLKLKIPKKEQKEWKEVEEKVKEIDKNHKKPVSKEPLVPIILIGGGAVAVYMTNLQYMIIDAMNTLINQNPQISEFLKTIPYNEILTQNIVHITFGIYTILVLIIFLIARFIKKRRKKRKK